MKNSSLLSTPNVLFMYGILIYNDERIKIRNNENTVIVIPVPMEHKYISWLIQLILRPGARWKEMVCFIAKSI